MPSLYRASDRNRDRSNLYPCHFCIGHPIATGILWVQCVTPELRFLKCSIKWDVLTFWFSQVSASLLHFYSLENTTLSLSLAYSPPSLTSFLFFILVFSRFSDLFLSCCVLLGNNDRALCISRCKRNRTLLYIPMPSLYRALDRNRDHSYV